MTIQTFPRSLAGQTAAFAVADPKNVVFDGSQFVVSNGTDYVAPPALTQDQLDAADAKANAKVAALKALTPTQVGAWVDANITTLPAAVDALKTLAIAVSILSRKL